MDALEPLLDPTEVARILRRSPRTLANWRVAGIGPEFVRFGSRIGYSPKVIAAFVEQHRRRSTSDAPELRKAG